ncbi:prepilin peptidase [Micrococcales bacterium 31B]|nr:prepilin peptidase [Micrococcales bacterium 31B]
MDAVTLMAGPVAWCGWGLCLALSLRHCARSERLGRPSLIVCAALSLALCLVLGVLGWGAPSVALTVLGSVSAVAPLAAWVDLREHRLPNRLVLIATGGGVILGGAHALAAHSLRGYGLSLAVAAGVALGLVVVALLAPRLVGMGDAKFAFVIALALLLQGAVAGLTGAYLALSLAGLVAVATLVSQRGRSGGASARRLSIACGPYLAAAPWFALVGGPPLAAWLGAV